MEASLCIRALKQSLWMELKYLWGRRKGSEKGCGKAEGRQGRRHLKDDA
jgi:hypothetical protein